MNADSARTLGWIRLNRAYTRGGCLHAPGCRTTGDYALGPEDQMALWELAATPSRDICGVCAGPTFRDPIQVMHFVAAADVWDARGRGTIEPWQVAAAGRLLAASLSGRMEAGEPEVSLTGRLINALAEQTPPRADAWAAYGAAIERMSGTSQEDREVGLRLAIARLNTATTFVLRDQPALLADDSLQRDIAARYRFITQQFGSIMKGLDVHLFALEGAS